MRYRGFLLLTLLAAPVELSAQSISVGKNVQVGSGLGTDPHYEMWLAADPAHAERLAACSIVWANEHFTSEVVTYVTLDRGATWRPTKRVRADKGNPSWDPACGYGPDGTLYS